MRSFRCNREHRRTYLGYGRKFLPESGWRHGHIDNNDWQCNRLFHYWESEEFPCTIVPTGVAR